jgi:hypothetical protein
MASTNTQKLMAMGMPSGLAKEVDEQSAATATATATAVTTAATTGKAEIAALTPSSTAADIVAALKA